MINTTALLLIDWQEGFKDYGYWGGNRNNPQAEENAAALLDLFRTKNCPVIHAIHHSLNENSPLRIEKPSGNIIQELAPKAEEIVFHKRVNSALIGTDLAGHLQRNQISHLVISGLTTNHCVSTTTRMAGNMGFDVTLIGDACATFDRVGPNGEKYEAELIHNICLSDLHEEFCQVKNSSTFISS
ncbi:MAG: cysteine hydrolase family protein [Alphaproteobacteria bacterium]|nr:cysteine hydrolase family protein [Alphaproteobacteria bacterium]